MFILKSFKSFVLKVFIPEELEACFLKPRILKGLVFLGSRGIWFARHTTKVPIRDSECLVTRLSGVGTAFVSAFTCSSLYASGASHLPRREI
jgi:hypothetical protein